MNTKPPNRWQSVPASLTKTGRAVSPDKCAFWVVIIGSLIVALFGA